MKNNFLIFPNRFFLPAALVSVIILSCGCIRLFGKAGYTHQGADDEYPKTKQIGFDTKDLIQRDEPEGNITV